MGITIKSVSVAEILPWRKLYRREMNCQIVHDSLHGREGWTEPYLIELDGEPAGYGSIVVGGPWAGTRTIFEFFVAEKQRARFFEAFEALKLASGADGIETQTNDIMLTAMLHTWAHDVVSEKIVFEDKLTTAYRVPGTVLRKREPEGDWLLLDGYGEVAAKGGILYHYNRPYGDIWMEVAEPFRRRGFGTYLVQELKRICREGGACLVRAAIRKCRFAKDAAESGVCALCAHALRKALTDTEAHPGTGTQVTQVVRAHSIFPRNG